GSNTQLQYNNGGTFGGAVQITFNSSTQTFSITGTSSLATTTVTGLLTANNFQSSGATISGGLIDNTPIGSLSPSTGVFTNLNFTNATGTGSLSLASLYTGSNLRLDNLGQGTFT